MGIRTLGAKFLRLANGFSSRVYRVRRGFIYSLSVDSPLQIETQLSNSQFVELQPSEIFGIVSWTGLSAETVRRRLHDGERCFALKYYDRIVAISWLHRGECYIRGVDLWIKATSSCYYSYGIITKAEERGNGFYRQLCHGLFDLAKSEGAGRIFQFVEMSNSVPQRVLPQFGYTAIPVVSRRMTGLRHATILDANHKSCERVWLRQEPTDVYLI